MTDVLMTRPDSGSKHGVILHRFSHAEYERLLRCGAIGRHDPVELVNGLLALRTDAQPPYGISVGIPPEILWGGERLPERRPLRRLTVPELDKLVNAGVLAHSSRFELAEGWVVDRWCEIPNMTARCNG